MHGRLLLEALHIVKDNLSTATASGYHIALVQFRLHIAIGVRLLGDQAIFGGAMSCELLHVRQLGYRLAILQIWLHDGAQWHRIGSTMLQPLVAGGT